MSVSLKPLDQQVIVITGASSGIGLATAKSAAAKGAAVVAAARSENALQTIVNDITSTGGKAIHVVADVSDRKQVEAIANAAIQAFGRIDTWVNNAGTSIYGKLEEVSDEDHRRLFDINFWGIVYGSMVALPYLKNHGGALINLGSEVSEAVIPFQGMYSATKHAIKGFTDALRDELQMENSPVSVTLIQPTAVNTPFPENARNYTDQEATLPSPQIDPQQVADAILSAAVKPARDMTVGMMAKVNTTVAAMLPSLGDKMSQKIATKQFLNERPRHRDGSLYEPSEKGRTHGINSAKEEAKK
jgi:short-subunit dehydrogenase